MKIFFIKKIGSVLLLFLVTNQIFSARAVVSLATNSNIKGATITFFTSDPLASPRILKQLGVTNVYQNQPSWFDSQLEGFTNIKWTEDLQKSDQQGRISVNYSLQLPTKIEGIEGDRDWEFLGQGRVNIGACGLLHAFGMLQGQ